MPSGGQRVAPIFTISSSSPPSANHNSAEQTSSNNNNSSMGTAAAPMSASQQLSHLHQNHQQVSSSSTAVANAPTGHPVSREEVSATSVKNVHMLQLEMRHSRRPPAKGPDHHKVLISGAFLALQGCLCLAGEVTNLCAPCTRLKLGLGLVTGFLDLFLALHCLFSHRLPGLGVNCARSVLISAAGSVFLNAASFVLFYATASWNLAHCNADIVAVLGVVVISNLCLGIPSAFLAGYITRHNAAIGGGYGGGSGSVGGGGTGSSGAIGGGGYRGHLR